MHQFTKKVFLTLLMASATTVFADDSFYEEVPVVSVVPQIERINNPRQECKPEILRESAVINNSSPTGSIVGGIAGALLGSTIGQGNGRVAAAAVGAGVGAIVGDRVGSNSSVGVVERPIERCVMVDQWQEVSRGYLVTYRYNNRDFTTMTNTQPGSTIKVRVDVSDANRPSPTHISAPLNVINQPAYYSPPQVIYHEPIRVYQSPSPVMIYGGFNSMPRLGFGINNYRRPHRGYGRHW